MVPPSTTILPLSSFGEVILVYDNNKFQGNIRVSFFFLQLDLLNDEAEIHFLSINLLWDGIISDPLYLFDFTCQIGQILVEEIILLVQLTIAATSLVIQQ